MTADQLKQVTDGLVYRLTDGMLSFYELDKVALEVADALTAYQSLTARLISQNAAQEVLIGEHIKGQREAEANVVALEKDRQRYKWLANRVLACDYGDNDAPGEQIGWRARADILAKNGERQPAFMFGASIDAAIDAQIEVRAALSAATEGGE